MRVQFLQLAFLVGAVVVVNGSLGMNDTDDLSSQDIKGKEGWTLIKEPELPDPWIHEELSYEENDTDKRNIFGLSHNAEDVKFMLYYSPKHPKRYDRLYDYEELTIRNARFKRGEPIIFIAHGFLSDAIIPNSTVQMIKNALLSKSIVNIIAVDWSKLSTSESLIAFLSYAEVTQNVPVVGRKIASLIEFLIELDIVSGPENIHLIGHSLGAHIMGVAGSEVMKRTGKPIDHITGLDPAGPLFEFINTKDKLDPTDAKYIDVLHTDIGMFGSSETLGTADFYANGGKGYAQPGCLNFTNSNPGAFIEGVSGICSHSRAYRLYVRTIRKTNPELYGCRCRVFRPFILPTSCTIQEAAICPDKVHYGYYAPKTAKGNYYVETKEATDIPFFDLGNIP